MIATRSGSANTTYTTAARARTNPWVCRVAGRTPWRIVLRKALPIRLRLLKDFSDAEWQTPISASDRRWSASWCTMWRASTRSKLI